ncbi:hypothetical protein GGU45_001397 [Niabella hirudinis]
MGVLYKNKETVQNCEVVINVNNGQRDYFPHVS